MLEIQDLHVKFHNRDREAVSGVSLTIQDGEILGLVGESGSGKSVTAMSVAGLLPRKQCDYTGRILLDGQELLHADRSVLREIQGAEIGVVFQEPQSCMDPLMKIGPQVEETLRIHTQMPERGAPSAGDGGDGGSRTAGPGGDLRQIPPRAFRRYAPAGYDRGGYREPAQAAAAGRAYHGTGCDHQAQILEMLKKLNRESGVSMLFISHNLNVVRKLCRRVAVMQRGVLVEEGDTDQVFYHPQHPYTQKLIDAIPTRNRKEERP